MTPLFLKKVGLSFARYFVASFLTGIVSVGLDLIDSGDVSAARAAVLALIGGAVAAGLRAVQALVTNLETPPELKQ